MPKSLSEFARSTQATGISGFLPESANVFYTQLFNAYSVGRVSDLLTARLRKEGWSEDLGVRAVLLLGVMEANNSADPSQPISLETGTSEERVVIGFSFTSSKLSADDVSQSIERVQAGMCENQFDYLIENLRRFADAFMIRTLEDKNRVEFILSLERVRENFFGAQLCGMEHVIIPPGTKIEMHVKSYEELGDMDHKELLETERAQADRRPKEEAEFKIDGDSEAKPEAAQLVKGKKEKKQAGGETIITSDAEEEDEHSQIVKSSGIRGLLKKVWPFKSTKKAEVTEPTVEDQVFSADAPVEQVENVQRFEADDRAKEFERKIASMKKGHVDEKELETILKEVDAHAEDEAAVELSANSELAAERSKLRENAKKLGQTLRQRDLEFKNKEQGFMAEFRKRDETLKQRDLALAHTKDQMQKMMSELEKLKTSGKSSNTEEASLKNKMQQTQTALATEKRQREEIQKKLDETRGQLATLQLTSKAQKTNTGDVEAMKEKLGRAHKESDELKRQVRDLQEKVKQSDKKDAVSPEQYDELRIKFENTSRAAQADKKNAERLARQLEDVKREDMRLKVENSRLLGELKRARHVNKTPEKVDEPTELKTDEKTPKSDSEAA